ncbi:MAG: LysM peptidoglycan-binding domain-containing protein [Hydrogenophilales bacterium]|nr:LysM peptidoglycan-binding domain-containing protein [Hydrogenophilales bacterium]
MRISALILSLAVAFPVLADTVKLRDDAPDRHVVVKGDTLWDISAKFLKTPWKWPELWQVNKAEIKNPHLIYPGDVVYLIMTPDGPRFAKIQTVKLSPRIHGEPIPNQSDAIPALPPEAIAPFIAQAGVIDAERLPMLPRILGADDDRVLLMLGDTAYATQGDGYTVNWSIVRPGADLIDPDTGVSWAGRRFMSAMPPPSSRACLRP